MPTENIKKPRIIDPKFFQVRLMNCGLDSGNSNYSLMKGKKAIDLMIQVNKRLAEDFVGMENKGALLCFVAVKLIDLYRNEERPLEDWFNMVMTKIENQFELK